MRAAAELGAATVVVLQVDGAFEAERTGVHLLVLFTDFADLLVDPVAVLV